MAVAIEGSITTAYGATDTIVLSRPGAATSGRYLLVICSWRSANTTMTLPSGWTTIINQPRSTSGSVIVAGKLMTNSEPTDYTFVQGSTAGGTCTALVLSGIHQSAPIANSGGVSTSNAASVVSPSISSIASGLVVRIAVAASATSTSFTWASGATEVSDSAIQADGSTYQVISVATSVLAQPGSSTSTNTASWSSTNGNLAAVTLVVADAPKTFFFAS